MEQITAKVLKRIVGDVVIALNEPAIVLGQFGGGKSRIILQAADEYDVECVVDIRLGQYDTVDLKGIPSVVENQTVWHPASTLPFKGNPKFADIKGIILVFFDEFNMATKPVFGVAYQITDERCCGEHVLMDNVRIICAGNRVADRGVTNALPEPLKNRLTQYELVISTRELCLHGANMGWEPLFMALWQFKEDLVCTWNPANPLPVSATPRTWEKAIKYYRALQHDPELMWASITGVIGSGPAQELKGFIETYKTITPLPMIVGNPMHVQMPLELSAMYATAMMVSKNITLKTADALMSYLERFKTQLQMPELYMMAMDMAVERDPALKKADRYIAYLRDYANAITGRT